MRVRQGGNRHDYPRTSHRVPMAAPIVAGLLCTSSLTGQTVGVGSRRARPEIQPRGKGQSRGTRREIGKACQRV